MKNLIVIFYVLLNTVVFWMIGYDYLQTYGSFNVLFSLMLSNILNIDSFLFGCIAYLLVSIFLIYGLNSIAKRKYEIAILISIILLMSIPFLNLNGL